MNECIEYKCEFLNIFDLDNTILYPSPYSLLWFFDDIEDQHDFAKYPAFRKMLEYGQLAPWFNTSYMNDTCIIITGRWDYNKQATEKFLDRHGILNCFDDIIYVKFDGYDSYLERKQISILDAIRKYNPAEVTVYEDCVDLYEWCLNKGFHGVLIENGEIVEIDGNEPR